MSEAHQLSLEEQYKTRMKKYKVLIAAMEKTLSKHYIEQVHQILKADESWFSDCRICLSMEELYSIVTSFHEEMNAKKHATPNDIRGLMNILNRR